VGRETHPWAPEAEREAGLGGGSELSEARRGERGSMPSWGMPFYLRCAATARATSLVGVLARGLAVRSGGAGGSASSPRGGPHGGGSMLGILIRRIRGSGAG
jgi:hypothetical protein